MISPSAPHTDRTMALTASAMPSSDAEQRVVPASFFGMHAVGLGAHHSWPSVPFGVYRLMDATPRWHALHTSPNRWSSDVSRGTGLDRIRYVLDVRDANAPAVAALYTIAGGPDGGFPPWLKRAKSRQDTLHAWQTHVRRMGSAFRGRIRYWEIWNEFDCACFYRGGIDLLVELTRVAREELIAIDPTNVIVAPPVTSKGVLHLRAFLRAGGGRYVDVIAWHPDLPSRPETDTATIRRIRGALREQKLTHLPLWATEGHAAAEDGVDPAAIVVRSYIILWATGHANFSWYAWDITDYGDRRSWVTLSNRGRPDQPAAAAAGYRAAYDWLVGHRIVHVGTAGDTWVASIARSDGRSAWIVWAAGRNVRPFVVPPGVHALYRIDGSSAPLAPGDSYRPTTSPVLLLRD